MAETFGEADVILRARLDQLNKDLAEGEKRVEESTERVTQAQVRAQKSVSAANDDASGSGYRLGVVLGFIAARFQLFRRAALLGVRALGLLPAIATAASVAMVALTTGGLALLITGFGLLANSVITTRRRLEEALEAFNALDGSRDKAIAFAEALDRIPIAGSAARQLFLMFSQDAGMATEAWARLVSKVEDGQVKVGLLGRALNGLINIIPPVGIARLFGFDADFVGQIEKANAQIERMNQLMSVQRGAQGPGRDIQMEAEQAARAAARDAELAGVQGVRRVQIEERHRFEDARRGFDELRRRSSMLHTAQMQEIRERAEEEGLTQTRTQEMLDEAARLQSMRIDTINRMQQEADERMQRAAQRRIELARQEQREQWKLAEQERERAVVADRMGERNMVEGAKSTRLRAAGDEFEAQRVDLEVAREEALLNAMLQKANDERLDQIRDFYDARTELIDAREKEQIKRDEELHQRKLEAERQREQREQERREQDEFNTQQTNDELRSRILQARMEAAGMEVEARQEAIRQRFQRMIDEMEREGNRVGADLARELRDLEIEAAGNQDKGREAEFQQITLSRFAPGMGDDKKVEKDQLAIQKRIEQNTRNPQPAVTV